MRVRLTADRCYPTRRTYLSGEVLDLPAPEAMRLVERGQAEPVGADIEAAAVHPPENAARQIKPTKRVK